MFDLDSKEYKSIGIVFSVIFFIPLLIAILVGVCLTRDIVLLITLIVMMVVYIAFILILFRLSKKKEHYLLIQDNGIYVCYKELSGLDEKLEIPYSEMKEIKYFRLFSIIAILDSILNRCIFYSMTVWITYSDDLDEKNVLVGYMDYKDVKKIAKEKNIKLKVR